MTLTYDPDFQSQVSCSHNLQTHT